MKVNYFPNGEILGVTGGEQSQIDAAKHRLFNVHHWFDFLILVKKIFVACGGHKASLAPRL